MSQNLYIDPQIYPQSKLSLLNPFKTTIKKKEVFELIDDSKDSKLVDTIKYLYAKQGDILPYDLRQIAESLKSLVNKFYDSKIKGESTTLTAEQVKVIENSIERIRTLMKNYPD